MLSAHSNIKTLLVSIVMELIHDSEEELGIDYYMINMSMHGARY